MSKDKSISMCGYSDRFSVAPGEPIEFKFSSDEPGDFQAEIVRLINGDTNPDGSGFRSQSIRTELNGTYPCRVQGTVLGSWIECGVGENVTLGDEGTLHAFVMATLPDKGDQAIVARFDAYTGVGWWFGIANGHLTLRLADGDTVSNVSVGTGFLPRSWYSATAVWHAGKAMVTATPVLNSYNSLYSPMIAESPLSGSGSVVRAERGARLTIGAHCDGEGVSGHFNGKIDAPKIFNRSLGTGELVELTEGRIPTSGLVAYWDFAADITTANVATDHVTDMGPYGLHGVCHNAPLRGVTGWNWRGREEVYRHAPEQYGAIHFHDDDLEDAGWNTDVVFTIPSGFESGVYALKATRDDLSDYVPFWVLPPRGTSTAKVLLLFPTASYLAYANDHMAAYTSAAESVVAHTPVLSAASLYLFQHPELGLSTYDSHNDGSGVAFTSRLRPIISIRPDFRHSTGSVWQFPADLHIVDWLEAMNCEYDVATDEELHAEGADLLRRYNVVLTGTHPEYYSEHMLDAWEEYLGDGGRAMYLGGNGFYWVIGYYPDKPHLVEVRRGESGCRGWQAQPGEYYLQTTGERSGLWRNRNRAPNKLFGVGFTSEGFDRSGPFRPLSDWKDERVAFVTAGCVDDQYIGDFGLVGGGAAGYEVDRYDLGLGTPPHSLLLASSDGQHSENYPRTQEEIYFPFDGMGGQDDFQIRADLVYFTTRNGGAVFSTSSISWAGSLSYNGFENNVSRITANVLERFSADGPVMPME